MVKTEIRLWYFCGQTRNRRGKNHGDFHFGGPDRIRTDDPYNANVVRSQSGKFSAHGLRYMVCNQVAKAQIG